MVRCCQSCVGRVGPNTEADLHVPMAAKSTYHFVAVKRLLHACACPCTALYGCFKIMHRMHAGLDHMLFMHSIESTIAKTGGKLP